MKKILQLVFLLVVCFLANAQFVSAGAAVLVWDANRESDLASYKIYYDTTSHISNCPSGYPHSVTVGASDNVGYWLSGLTPGEIYYFQVTALDSSGNESACSTDPGEVSKSISQTSIRSDVNNSSTTNTADALLTLRHSLELSMNGTSWIGNRITGDNNCDSISNSADALLVLRYSLGLDMTNTAWCE